MPSASLKPSSGGTWPKPVTSGFAGSIKDKVHIVPPLIDWSFDSLTVDVVGCQKHGFEEFLVHDRTKNKIINVIWHSFFCPTNWRLKKPRALAKCTAMGNRATGVQSTKRCKCSFHESLTMFPCSMISSDFQLKSLQLGKFQSTGNIAMARVSACRTAIYVLALLVCGSLNTLTMKKLG